MRRIRQDSNSFTIVPEPGPESSQGGPTVDNSAQSLQTEGGVESSRSQDLAGFPKDFSTRFLPNSDATIAHGGAQPAPGGQGATTAPKTRRRPSVAATPADL